jgi:hypothetical protein
MLAACTRLAASSKAPRYPRICLVVKGSFLNPEHTTRTRTRTRALGTGSGPRLDEPRGLPHLRRHAPEPTHPEVSHRRLDFLP